MAKLIHACMICGVVFKEVPDSHYSEDVLSHGICPSRACHSQVALIGNGFIPRPKRPAIWSPLVPQLTENAVVILALLYFSGQLVRWGLNGFVLRG